MRFKSILLLTALFFTIMLTRAQSLWDVNHLERVKASLSSEQYKPAYDALLIYAENLMLKEPVSVMMKEKTPASGDKHDYMSQARYFWPDPDQPDGLPYINIDGKSNPELEKLDRNKLGEMAYAVVDLTLAWYFSGDEKYARKAVEWIQTWFINDATRKNPNMNFAQMIPGHNDGKGRGIGIIDSYSYIDMLEAIQLLERFGSLFPKRCPLYESMVYRIPGLAANQ